MPADIFIKTPKPKYLKFGVVEREVKWLKRLQNSGRTPILKGHTQKKIIMGNVGERVTAATMPEDWEGQCNEILQLLEEFSCRHNDIKPGEVLVKGGKLFIVDFGWATEVGQKVPSSWPQGLGSSFKAPNGFDDRYSLFKAIKHVRHNGGHTNR